MNHSFGSRKLFDDFDTIGINTDISGFFVFIIIIVIWLDDTYQSCVLCSFVRCGTPNQIEKKVCKIASLADEGNSAYCQSSGAHNSKHM